MLFCFSYPRQLGYVGTIARIHIGLGLLRRPIADVHLALDYVATSSHRCSMGKVWHPRHHVSLIEHDYPQSRDRLTSTK